MLKKLSYILYTICLFTIRSVAVVDPWFCIGPLAHTCVKEAPQKCAEDD